MKLGHSSNNLNDTGQHKKSLLNAKNMTQCLHVSFYTNDEAHACISLCEDLRYMFHQHRPDPLPLR